MTFFQRIETERLIIRPFEVDDYSPLHAITSDAEVMTYLPEGQMTEDETRTFLKKNMGENTEAYATVLKHDHLLIGYMVFHKWFAPDTYEIGWVFHKGHHGKGYATEAALSILRQTFEELKAHRVIATCQPGNPASWRVMEKIGMRKEAHLRKGLWMHEKWWDEFQYALLKEEWVERSN